MALMLLLPSNDFKTFCEFPRLALMVRTMEVMHPQLLGLFPNAMRYWASPLASAASSQCLASQLCLLRLQAKTQPSHALFSTRIMTLCPSCASTGVVTLLLQRFETATLGPMCQTTCQQQVHVFMVEERRI